MPTAPPGDEQKRTPTPTRLLLCANRSSLTKAAAAACRASLLMAYGPGECGRVPPSRSRTAHSDSSSLMAPGARNALVNGLRARPPAGRYRLRKREEAAYDSPDLAVLLGADRTSDAEAVV